MYLKIKGKPLRLPKQLCKQAAKHYALKLLGPRLYHLVEVEIEFSADDMDSDVYAYCDWNDTNYRARDFTITLRPNLSKKQTLLALAHEMVHIKQYAKGELRDYVRTRRCKWRGEIFDERISYWDAPWEIEAHGREKGLYISFINEQRAK
jgi:hypothetical protein